MNTKRSPEMNRLETKKGDAYIARSRPKRKLVIARLINRLTNKVIFSHFSMTEKKRRKKKKREKMRNEYKNEK